jgi:hypothetical protein
MAINVHLAIILPTISIHFGQHLWRPFKNTKQKNKLNLWKHRKHAERILKDFLVLRKLGLPLFVIHLVFWDKKILINIMIACVILHNMIIEDERDLSLEFFFDNIGSRVRPKRNPDRIYTFLETSPNWGLGVAFSAAKRSHREPLAASRGKVMPSSFIHLISYLCMCEKNNYLCWNHSLFV